MNNKLNDYAEDNISWYTKSSNESNEDIIRVPNAKNRKASMEGKPIRSGYDTDLKLFIKCCEELDSIIVKLNRERDRPRTNEEYFKFKKSLGEMRDKAVLEAYSRKCLTWK